MTSRLTVVLVALAAVAAGLSGGALTSLAALSGGATTTASFTAGVWGTTLYLHNDPTPPVGDTVAQAGASMTASAPTATTLYDYDTDCDSAAGRQITRGAGLATEAATCRYARWRSPAFGAATSLSGKATLVVWARKSANGGNDPTLRGYLRDYDPATSTYVEIASAGQTVSTGNPSAFASEALAWSGLSYAVPAGHLLELKLVATSPNRNVQLAYDTTTYAATLTLP